MKKGFTLIELLVVVLIIGILSAVALPQYTKAVAKARSTEALTNTRSLAKAEQIYYMANGEYSSDLSVLDIEVGELEEENKRSRTKDFSYFCNEANGCCQAWGKITTGDMTPVFEACPSGTLSCICSGTVTEPCSFCKMFGAKEKSGVYNGSTMFPIKI